MGLADIDAGLRLCRLSQWDQVRRDWERFVVGESSSATVALVDDRVMGTAATSRYGTRFGWIGMVLVDPASQGRGVGASLLRHTLDELRDVAVVRLDATPAGHPLYVRQGFADECPLLRMERTVGAPVMTADSSVSLMTPADLQEIGSMDLGVFGAPRAGLLEWMYAGAPEYAVVARRNERIAGYVLGRHGFQFEHLGPIIAADAHLASTMTATCLSRYSDRPFIIDATGHDAAWLHFLDQAGFREQRPFTRMYRGGTLPIGNLQQQFAVLGPEFG